MASATFVDLSRNDTTILEALFDPEGVLSNDVGVLSVNEKEAQRASASIVKEELSAVQLLNKETPTQAEVRQAICKLTKIISQNVSYASAYNNRAQATRLLFDIKDMARHPDEVRDIIEDLTMAISYATPANLDGGISDKHASVLSSAHTHRGYLLWLASRPSTPEGVFSCIGGLSGLSKQELEEFGSREFSIGGKYGNKAARELSVRTNPYAKLCGSIVKEALRREMAEDGCVT